MLFLAQYMLDPERIDVAIAKRMEWDTVQPEGFHLICEYSVHGKPPPFSGFMVFETDSAEHVNFLVLFFGNTVTFDIRACSDALDMLRMSRAALGGTPEQVD
jgi:hypothetical protein